MSRHAPRLAALIGAALMGTTLFAAPAAAAGQMEDFGAKLKCKYERVDAPLDYGELHRIAVSPPVMFGEHQSSLQTVSWRFFLHGSVEYRSPLQKKTTWEGHAANFSAMHVEFSPPRDENDWITASIRMIWYGADGSKERVIDHEMESEYEYVNGKLKHHLYAGGCAGTKQLEFVDGPFPG